MTAITLAPDEATTVEAALTAGEDVCHLVVKGDVAHPERSNTYPSVVYPPKRWTDLTGDCETCGGDGTTPDCLSVSCEHDPDCYLDCPDCIDGRKLIELRKACPHDCQRFGGKVPGFARGSNWDWVPCWCEGMGSILLAHATVEVLPVLDETDHDESPYDHACRRAEDGRVAIVRDGHFVTPFLPIEAVPGEDFVVALKRVQRP